MSNSTSTTQAPRIGRLLTETDRKMGQLHASRSRLLQLCPRDRAQWLLQCLDAALKDDNVKNLVLHLARVNTATVFVQLAGPWVSRNASDPQGQLLLRNLLQFMVHLSRVPSNGTEIQKLATGLRGMFLPDGLSGLSGLMAAAHV